MISYVIYYEYYFGDPLGNYGEINEATRDNYDASLSAVLKFEFKDYENIKQYQYKVKPGYGRNFLIPQGKSRVLFRWEIQRRRAIVECHADG